MIGDDLGEAILIMLPSAHPLLYVCGQIQNLCVYVYVCLGCMWSVYVCACVLAAFYFCLSGHLSAPECLQLLYVATAACSKVKHTKLSNYLRRVSLSSERILVIREEKNSVLVIFEETCMLTPV